MAEAMLDSGRQEIAGRLRVSMPVLFGRHCVAPVLTDLARRHPKLELDLDFSDRLVDLIEDGFDLAVRNGVLGEGAGLMARRLAYQCMTVCAAPAYLKAHGTPRTPEELRDYAAIAYGRSGRVREWSFPRDNAPSLALTPQARLRFDDLEAIADAAASGMGLAWLPCWLIRDRTLSGELVRVLDNWPGARFDIFAVWTQTPHLPLRVRLAVDTLAQALPRLMG